MNVTDYKTPGIYKEEIFPAGETTLPTGVPAFLGYVRKPARSTETAKFFYQPRLLTLWPQFQKYFGEPLPFGYLSPSVRGFFENGGGFCYVVPLNPGKNLTVICEVVAMNHLLRYSGEDSARQFNDRLIQRMAKQAELREYLAEDYE